MTVSKARAALAHALVVPSLVSAALWVITTGLLAGTYWYASAASVITHELGVLRAGLARHEPASVILLAPWTVWATFILTMWTAVGCFLPRKVMVACLAVNAGIGIWLGVTQDPAMFLATAFMGVALSTWWAGRAWQRARAQVGDRYLIQPGFAEVYADLLTSNCADDYTFDRAVRLRHPDQLDARPVSSTDLPVTAPASSTSTR